MKPTLIAASKEKLWSLDVYQEVSSGGTSVAILPRLFSRCSFLSGTINADIGGGRFDKASHFLFERGVENLVYDPFNRSYEHNCAVALRVQGGQCATATLANVLNVIADPVLRDRVLAQAADAIGDDGRVFIQVFEREKTGVGCLTSKGWQENRRLESYLPEIQRHFNAIALRDGVIVASAPVRCAYVVETAEERLGFRSLYGALAYADDLTCETRICAVHPQEMDIITLEAEPDQEPQFRR
jgi:hypothetical protein